MSWWAGSDDQAAVERRLAAIERKVDAAMAHLGIADEEPTYPEVEALVRQGRQIQAVKAYRERTGAGLAEAKRAVDAMAARET